jgi:GNAT superfamily N-acetyltransferase
MLRPAVPTDAEALAALIRLAFAHQPVRTDPPPSALEESGVSVAAHLGEGGGGIVADRIGADKIGAQGMVAALLWREEEGGLYVGRLAVHPQWRGQGLARRLIAAAEEVARQRGLERLFLSTRLVLAGNRRLFAACGFAEISFHAHPGYARPTYVTMEKRLGKFQHGGTEDTEKKK